MINRARRLASVASVGIAVLLAGCASPGSMRVRKRANLARLTLGMDKRQVLMLLGNRQVLDIANPCGTESHRGSDGVTWDILFYYTDINAGSEAHRLRVRARRDSGRPGRW